MKQSDQRYVNRGKGRRRNYENRKTTETMAEGDVEKLRALAAARSCYCLLQRSSAAAQPSSSYTGSGRNSYSKRQRSTRYPAIGCRDMLQKSRRLARPRRHAERCTDHVVLRVTILDGSLIQKTRTLLGMISKADRLVPVLRHEHLAAPLL